MKFKVGDRVKRISGNHGGMSIGQIGTIIEIMEEVPDSGENDLCIKEYGVLKTRHSSKNFVKISESSMDFLDCLKANEDNYYV